MRNERQITSTNVPKAGIAQKPCVYLLVNLDNGAIYTGVTPTLAEQVWKHKNHMIEGFSKKFNITSLVWFEVFSTIESAYKQARLLKNSPFEVKQGLVEQSNPKWQDLYSKLNEGQPDSVLKAS